MAFGPLIKNPWNCNNSDESAVSPGMGYIQIHIVLPEGAIRGRQGLIDANKQKENLTESTNFSSVSGVGGGGVGG